MFSTVALSGLLPAPVAMGSIFAAQGPMLDVPLWMGVPFVLLLGAVALMPLAAEHFWHSNRNKGLVAGALAIPVAGYLLYLGPATNHTSTHALWHGLSEYASFIVLLAALYTVAGGIVLRADLRATPLTNAALLGLGAVLANVVGTTGASMLLVRPLLRTNRQRRHTRHLPVFFIFLVGNLGGLLTPLGDPPLFLGFLGGVDFFWTFSLWPLWLAANGSVLLVFLVWDTVAYRREDGKSLALDMAQVEPLRIEGGWNIVFLLGILLAVMLQSKELGNLPKPWGELLMIAMGAISYWLTPRRLHRDNEFGWGPIVEVAVLFAGIFITMIPALAWLGRHGPELGVTRPAQFFWWTGGLSSFLDNAPTYLVFATIAAGPNDLAWLSRNEPLLLQAISAGAVFMGAMTYIGNGPNFMVKAIAQGAGYRMPSFFGYMAYSCLILLPVFGVVTVLFF